MRTTNILGAALLVVTAGVARGQPATNPGHPLQDSGTTLSMGGKCAQHKLAFVDGRWWGVFATSRGIDFYSLNSSRTAWSRSTFADAHVTSDALSRADVLWTGSSLLVLTDERVGTTKKLCLRAYRYVAPVFVLESGFPVDVVTGVGSDTIAQNVQTVVVDSVGRAWVTYRSGTSGIVKASTGVGPAGWTTFGPAMVMADLSAGLGDTPGYMVGVTFGGDKTGIFWMDQRDGAANGFKFRWRRDSASPTTWAPEEMAQGGLYDLADDHANVQSYEGKIYAVVKTNFNTVGKACFELLRRDVDGTWHVWNVLVADGSYRDDASRPILVLEPARRLVHVMYNGGGVVRKTTSMDAPDFSAAPVRVIYPSTGVWNTQTTSQLVDATSGLVVVCDGPKSATTWQFWGEVPLGAAPPPATVSSIVVTPNPASTTTGGSLTFSATARDAGGNTVSTTFSWATTGGTIDQSGHYTAPITSGTYDVSASSQGVTGHATVNVTDGAAPPPPPPPSSETIVDNDTAGFSVLSGDWAKHFTTYYYGPNCRTLDSTSGGQCRWSVALAAGTYEVYAWWPSRGSTTLAKPTYTIHTANGDVSVPVDQTVKTSWGVWNKLGTFTLDGSASVTVTAAAGQAPAADAMRFVAVAGGAN